MLDLGPPDFLLQLTVTASMTRAYVVGAARFGSVFLAALWTDEGIVNLGSLPGGTLPRTALRTTSMTPASFSSANRRTTDCWGCDTAVVWQDGDIIDLGRLPGGIISEAVAINNAGQIIGYSDSDTGERAVVWTGRRRCTNLNDP